MTFEQSRQRIIDRSGPSSLNYPLSLTMMASCLAIDLNVPEGHSADDWLNFIENPSRKCLEHIGYCELTTLARCLEGHPSAMGTIEDDLTWGLSPEAQQRRVDDLMQWLQEEGSKNA